MTQSTETHHQSYNKDAEAKKKKNKQIKCIFQPSDTKKSFLFLQVEKYMASLFSRYPSWIFFYRQKVKNSFIDLHASRFGFPC
jgi:hypothetical protein